jgi:hypothetical protein
MKVYRDANGYYLGGFDDDVPPGAIEVSYAPNSALAQWVNGAWVEPPEAPSPTTIFSTILALIDHPAMCWQAFAWLSILQLDNTSAQDMITEWVTLKQRAPAWFTADVETALEGWANTLGLPLD